MLIHLSVNNVAIANHLEMEFKPGMTVITGETGAGKSIMLDALGLALGDRADSGVVRHGCERAEIHAAFEISTIEDARRWLQDNDLLEGDECILRRVITREGRSRGYINGRPVTLSDLRELGGKLIDIHSQHAHQSLLKKSQQQRLLDEFAGCAELAQQVARISQRYQRVSEQLQQLQSGQHEMTARAQLLGYQVNELEELALQEGELEALELEQRQLASGEQTLQACQHAVALCSEGELNVVSILHQALRSLHSISAATPAINSASELLNSALIQTEEAERELQHHIDSFELDPERLLWVEQRLTSIYDIARKHHVGADELVALHQSLAEELQHISGGSDNIDALTREQQALVVEYSSAAGKLSKKRRSAANRLQQQIEAQLKLLSMGNCQFCIALHPRSDEDAVCSGGNEDVQFLVSTNPGQPAQALGKIASGGELSRISLAIQVITARTSAIPTLVFDEVDVGVGGATAEVVGNLLRELGGNGQVLCVTHQPQVASKGQQHIMVNKQVDKKSVSTRLQLLSDEEKIEEIARMLGGIAITDQSLAHAREMLTH